MQEELQAAGQEQQRPPAVLKFRPAGSKDWQHPCVLQPGLHLSAADNGSSSSNGSGSEGVELAGVHISRCCATTRILLLPGAATATQAEAAEGASAVEPSGLLSEVETEPAHLMPLQIQVQCRQLQVCLWDDERQRLLPLAGPAGRAMPPLGRELFSLTLDQLSLVLARQQYLTAAAAAAAAAPAGAAAEAASGAWPLHAWQQQALQVMAAQLTAAAVQVDSFLPGSEQPVLLTSLPPEDVGAAPQRLQGPPLQLALEVHHCVPQPAAASAAAPGGPPWAASSSSGGRQMSLRNTWVHDLLVQLPTLAVAADDALLLFVDRLSNILSAGTGDGGTADGGGSGHAGDSPGGNALQQQSQMELLQQALAAEAAGAAASRLFIARAAVESGGEPPCQLLRRRPWHSRIACCCHHAPRQLFLCAWQRPSQCLATTIWLAAMPPPHPPHPQTHHHPHAVRLLLDAHITAGTAGVPVAVDTYRAPVTLGRIAAHDVLFRCGRGTLL